MNAIRHTPADGAVEVTGRAVGDGVELAVTDGCGGHPARTIARVFDVAWQGTSARTPTRDVSGRPRRRPRPRDRQGHRRGPPRPGRGANQAPGCRFVVTLPT